MNNTHVDRIRRDPDFIELSRSRRSFGVVLTIIMLVIYYGYIGLVAYQKPLIAQPLFGAVTVGLVMGIGVILSAIILTGIYVLRANGKFDQLSRQIVANNERSSRAAVAGTVPGGRTGVLEGVR